jgi:thiol-disulfide isomerase/thioredoxin
MGRARHAGTRALVRTALALLTVLAAGCTRAGDEEAFRPIAVGAPVPQYAVRTLDGDTARVGGAQPLTLLHVWATWCAPCEKEFPDIQALHRDYGPRGLRILAVSVDEGEDAVVREFVQTRGATFAIGRDRNGSIRRRYQGIGVPESYLISPDGTLLLRHFGALPEGAAAMRAAIESALPVVRAEPAGGAASPRIRG